MAPRLKILLSNSHPGLHTGSGIQLFLLARELVRRGHEVTAAFNRKAGAAGPAPELSRLREAGVKVALLPFAKLKYSYTIPVLMEFGQYLWDHDFDVVHSFAGKDFNYVFILSYFAPMGALILNRGTCVPLDVFNSIKYRSGRVRKIIAVSEAVKDTLVQSGRIRLDKIQVIYSGFDAEAFDPGIDGGAVRSELGLPLYVPVIGTVGSLQFKRGHLKGGMELLTAAGLILKERPEARFLLVGEINRERFEKAAGPLGIADRFLLTGFRRDVARMMAACDFIIVPSVRAEGLTGTIRESMAMKRPVVATDVGGNRELVTDGETGFLAPPSDPAALARGALQLLSDRARTRAMGQAARQKVERLCSLTARVDAIEKIYRYALESSPSPRRPNFLQRGIHNMIQPLLQRFNNYMTIE
ncbi:MAG TPA: glycosyltransferase family 4 protein [bacterium]|nr:glycosyltransferase family 4 protein [bacterium]